MVRRVLDLTQTCHPTNIYQRDYPPQWSDFEATGPEYKRVEMQKMVRAEPFHLDGNPDELLMNITIGHSTGHTHVDCFLHDWESMFEEVPKDIRWAQRDIAQMPSHQLLGPVAIVDVSEVAPYGEITLDFFKEKAKHVQPEDMVFIKSGHPALQNDPKYKAGHFTVVPPSVAVWLAQEKQCHVCGFDHKINGNFITWSRTEKAFYRNGILMIDRMANLDQLESGARYFASVGLSFKFAGVDDSPARVFVIDKLEDLDQESKTTDLFFPIRCGKPKGEFPFERSEPYALRQQIKNRLRLENIHITQTEYEGSFGGPGFMGYKSFCASIGTHLQVPTFPIGGIAANADFDLSSISTDRLWGKCVLVDAWGAGVGQDVTRRMLETAPIEEGCIVLIRTSYSDYYASSPDSMIHSPGMTDQAIAYLIQKKVKMVITDFASVETARHQNSIGVHEHLARLFFAGILVVNNAYSMWRLTRQNSIAFVSPMAFPGINASPCRVLVYEEYK